MKKIINIVVMLILIGCLDTPQKKTGSLIFGKWKGYLDSEYIMDIEFFNDFVIMNYKETGTCSKKNYFIKNDTLYIDGIEDSRIIKLNKNTLELGSLSEDYYVKFSLTIHDVIFKR